MAPVSIPCSRTHILHSRINGRSYPINVSLPLQYCTQPDDTTHYSVLYLLDDEMKAATPQERMRSSGDGTPGGLILVGIGWPPNPAGIPGGMLYHSVDYLTPAAPSYADTGIALADLVSHRIARANTRQFRDKVMHGIPGEAPIFLRVLQEEIIPLIEHRYRATTDRGLFGHSNGGFFAAFAMFEAPGLFQRIAIGSPAFWWNDDWIFAREAEFRRMHKSLNVDLLLMASDEEPALTQADIYRFAQTLEWRDYEGMKVRTSVTHGGHFSTDDVRQTLDLLYPLHP